MKRRTKLKENYQSDKRLRKHQELKDASAKFNWTHVKEEMIKMQDINKLNLSF